MTTKTSSLQTRQNAPGGVAPVRIPMEAARKALRGLGKRLQALLFRRETLILTNHGQASAVILANAFPFRIVQDNWIMVPFGDFKNVGPIKNGRPVYPNGVIQRVDKESSDAMVTEFNSVIAKVGRALFGGRPWQIGHPDQDPTVYTDQKAYGWIMNAKTGADGFYMEVNWTPAGETLKTDGSFKYYSPAWTAPLDSVRMENGVPVVRPTKLLSCGFTNNPNIPVIPLANDAREHAEKFPGLQHIDVSDLTEEERAQLRLELDNGGTSAGAKKGWETRRKNSAGLQKSAAKVTAKKVAERKGPSDAEKAQGVRVKGGTIKWSKTGKNNEMGGRGDGKGHGVYHIIKHSQGHYTMTHEPFQGARTSVGMSTRKADLYHVAEKHVALKTEEKARLVVDPVSHEQREALAGRQVAAQPHAAVAAATKKPGGLISKLIGAFKNPHAHSGDAIGNAK